MSVQQANIGVVKNGLVLYYNRSFPRSFRGESTTNLIATYGNGVVNSYPSVGNQWGTYNTNQYNGGSYFSIGAISSVSSNIVTTATPHGLRTFDVVRPQTTGGGVTGGTDYYVLKISNTQFSLHTYNANQDGSVSMADILAPILRNTKISINSTSFPTMWWGAPHLPNSGIIKEIIPNGFNFAGRRHDCLRLNWHRPDGVVDAMAYGVQPSYAGSTQYTFSAYIRAASQSAIGGTIRMETYHAGPNVGGPSSSCPPLSANWIKWTWTWTSNATPGVYLFYYWPNMTCPAQVDISEMQFEAKSYATGITFSSRSANTVAGGGGLIDLSLKRNDCDLSNAAFNSTGFYFNGSNSYVIAKTYTRTDPFWLSSGTISIWFKASVNQNGVLVGWGDNGTSNFGSIEITANWTSDYSDESLIAETFTTSVGPTVSQRAVIRKGNNYYANGAWTNVTAVFNDNYNDLKIYINGVLEATTNNGGALGSAFLNVSTSTSYFNIGRRTYGGGGEYFNGEIDQVMVYERILTPAEIKRNFDSQRGTYQV
jgi:hypothetical protein